MPLLTYRFIDTFPVDLNAVPMSYDGSSILQVTVVFSYLRHTIEKHGNAQQSIREKLSNTNQSTQINPLRPRIIANEITPSSSSPTSDTPVGYVSGKPYYGPFHEHMGVKMVGAEHSPYPHAIIYDTIGESLPESVIVGDVVTEINPAEEQQEQQQEQQQEDNQQQQQQQEDNQQQQQQDNNNQQQQQQQDNNNQQQQNQGGGGGGYYGGYGS